ncbi:MAG: flagellar motor switch protein FliM, partial [Pseudomonadota bacterium]
MAADEILSTEELDELMRAVSDGNVGTIAHSDASRHTALPYDFTAPRRIIANILPTLDMINGRFADAVGSTVYNMLQQRPQVSISAPQMVTMGEYMRTLPLPASINQVKVLPLRGTALMVLEPHLVTLMVDGFFGGTSQ